MVAWRRLIDKFDAARIAFPPDHAAVLGRLEAIQRQIEFEGGGVMGVGVKHGSVIVDIHHLTGMAPQMPATWSSACWLISMRSRARRSNMGHPQNLKSSAC
jgi:hypothetical protein